MSSIPDPRPSTPPVDKTPPLKATLADLVRAAQQTKKEPSEKPTREQRVPMCCKPGLAVEEQS